MKPAPESEEALFQAAVELTGSKRAAFLEGACHRDSALRARIEMLLAAHEAEDSLLAEPSTAKVRPATIQLALANVPDDEAAGRIIGPYRLLEKVGEGGMGEVYRAQDTRLGREVGIKMLRAPFSAESDRLRRFEQEARAASALNHPNIITIHEIGNSDGRLFIATEFIGGRTLRQMISPTGMQVAVALDLCVQAAAALTAAHASGIIHRDIKPENIMVRHDGYVKVLDFGLAKLTDQKTASMDDDTTPGMIMGTIRYMSPEQARGTKVDARTDIFSLGVVIYEMITGCPPFGGATIADVVASILKSEPRPLASYSREIPAELEGILAKALAKDREARYQTIEDFALDLQKLKEELQFRIRQERSGQPASRASTLAIPLPSRHTVGRAKERAELCQSFETVAQGSGLLLCVSGEPGIGKTTLVEDFLVELNSSKRPCTMARGRCSERLAGTEAYLPFLEALDSLLHGEDAERVAQTMRRLAPTWYVQVAALSAENPSDAHLIAEAKTGSQERMKRELAAFFQEVSRSRPLLLFFDDLHWADISTIDLLTYLATKFQDLRLLVVATYRPSDLLLVKHPLLQVKPDWQARGLCRELAMEFLSAADIERYLALEFPEHRFPSALTSVIQDKTEGSPLFMVDLVRDLRNRKVIAHEQGHWRLARAVPEIERDLPESVRGMIERKIGQLSEEDRRLLEAASVQGYEFDSAVVGQVLNLGANEVEERLQKLERVFAFVRFVSEKELPNHSLTLRYRFVHVLYQNTFHGSLRATRKVELSRTVAQTIEQHYGEQRASIANELAMLWESAREYAAAADYFRLAAQHAVQVFALQESVTLARRGIAMLQHLPDSGERRAQELFLQVVLGNSLMATRGFAAPELEEICSRARELCRQVGETPHLLPVIFAEYGFHFVRANLRRALEVAREFLARAEQQPRDPAFLAGHRNVGMPLLCMGELAAAREHFEQAVTRYAPEEHRFMAFLYGHDVGMASNINLAVTLWLLGYPDAGRKHSRKSLDLARGVPHAASQAYSLTHSAMVRSFCGEWPEALELAEQAIALTASQGLAMWLAWAMGLRGRALAERGQVKEGIDQIRQGLESAQVIKAELWGPYYLCLLAEANCKDGNWPAGYAALDEAQRLIEKNEERYWEPEVYRLRGELLLRDGEPEADACFQRALEIARRQQSKSLELRAALSLARSWQRQGKPGEARQMLAQIYHWFTEGFDTADLKQAKALLAELE